MYVPFFPPEPVMPLPRFTVRQGAIQDAACDALVVNLFAGVTAPGGATGAVDAALGGAITDLIGAGDLTGAAGEVKTLYPRGAIPAKRVLVVGLGPADAFDLHAARRAAGAAARAARDAGAKSVATIVHGAGIGGLDAARAAQATVEGMGLALYRYDAPKQKRDERSVDEITVVDHNAEHLAEVEAGVKAGDAIAEGVALARDLANGPPNICTPGYMADTARRIAAEAGLDVEVGDRAWAAGNGMGAFLAVAQGAGYAPAFIILGHNAARTDLPTVVLVGKGVTFDTGGISIKPADGMDRMKTDMSGGAAVAAALCAIAELKPPVRVVGVIPIVENMPGGRAIRPGDVLRAASGKSVEVNNTDAEGRLILGDALWYAQQKGATHLVDVATLTGACVVALGKFVSGLFASDDAWRERVRQAGARAGDRLWPMPLDAEFGELLKSDIADIVNTGGRAGGAITAAWFLKEFTGGRPWAHLDIAGTAWADDAKPYCPKGPTGAAVRTLVELALAMAAEG